MKAPGSGVPHAPRAASERLRAVQEKDGDRREPYRWRGRASQPPTCPAQQLRPRNGQVIGERERGNPYNVDKKRRQVDKPRRSGIPILGARLPKMVEQADEAVEGEEPIEAEKPENGRSQRARSQIEFPYSDLESAADLARTLLQSGGGSAAPTSLAAWMDQSARGGTFRSRLSAARLFGFIEIDRSRVTITDLGRQAVDPSNQAAAFASAFLRVPLFSAVFEKHQGYALPPAAAIERQIVDLGVPSKQKERARQVLVKSATAAGYIDAKSGRLARPAVGPLSQPQVNRGHDQAEDGKTGGSGGGGGYHPFVQGLLDELPDKSAFEQWSIEDQAEWLRAAVGIFKLLSKAKGRISVTVQTDMKTATDQ